ncbi:hypothetical protein GCM10008967_32970 [Bacillus carboniphilus]|uniref:Aminoglycoside phosphotransferase domain-containing protein n=1 Tax=Bacillus carboniphilus TaxID=86663 RepID=A0ABN0WJZ6_9BACI
MLQIEVNKETLHTCVSGILETIDFQIKTWKIEAMSSRTVNFTTKGIFRLSGLADVMGEEVPWSLVVKVIQPESEEKDDTQHHNYWKREALVYQSGLLSDLPTVIRTPKCYAVEEVREDSIWIWLEELKEDNSGKWTESQFASVAKKLGIFHGAYLTGKLVPMQEWICQNWLESWIDGCKMYASNPEEFLPFVEEETEDIWSAYKLLNQNLDKHLDMLKKLPQVLSHQDLSQQNMYMDPNGENFKLIDWQYLSISSVGEELGKLFGVALSQDDIPIDRAEEYMELLFSHYVEGLGEAGWRGDTTIPMYSYYLSFACRSFWEVPKLIKLLAEPKVKPIEPDKLNLVSEIVNLQTKFGRRADNLFQQVSQNLEVNHAIFTR